MLKVVFTDYSNETIYTNHIIDSGRCDCLEVLECSAVDNSVPEFMCNYIDSKSNN